MIRQTIGYKFHLYQIMKAYVFSTVNVHKAIWITDKFISLIYTWNYGIDNVIWLIYSTDKGIKLIYSSDYGNLINW
jgi:lipoprotein signal peptidase